MPNAKTKNKKILIVEDEAPILKALSDGLKREEFVVFEAKNGKEGLEAAFKNRPDLILVDILMPIMDGTVMLKELRKDEWGKLIPAIILTNLTNTEKIEEALEEGVYDYLLKTDWKLEDIIKKIKEKLKI